MGGGGRRIDGGVEGVGGGDGGLGGGRRIDGGVEGLGGGDGGLGG